MYNPTIPEMDKSLEEALNASEALQENLDSTLKELEKLKSKNLQVDFGQELGKKLSKDYTKEISKIQSSATLSNEEKTARMDKIKTDYAHDMKIAYSIGYGTAESASKVDVSELNNKNALNSYSVKNAKEDFDKVSSASASAESTRKALEETQRQAKELSKTIEDQKKEVTKFQSDVETKLHSGDIEGAQKLVEDAKANSTGKNASLDEAIKGYEVSSNAFNDQEAKRQQEQLQRKIDAENREKAKKLTADIETKLHSRDIEGAQKLIEDAKANSTGDNKFLDNVISGYEKTTAAAYNSELKTQEDMSNNKLDRDRLTETQRGINSKSDDISKALEKDAEEEAKRAQKFNLDTKNFKNGVESKFHNLDTKGAKDFIQENIDLALESGNIDLANEALKYQKTLDPEAAKKNAANIDKRRSLKASRELVVNLDHEINKLVLFKKEGMPVDAAVQQMYDKIKISLPDMGEKELKELLDQKLRESYVNLQNLDKITSKTIETEWDKDKKDLEEEQKDAYNNVWSKQYSSVYGDMKNSDFWDQQKRDLKNQEKEAERLREKLKNDGLSAEEINEEIQKFNEENDKIREQQIQEEKKAAKRRRVPAKYENKIITVLQDSGPDFMSNMWDIFFIWRSGTSIEYFNDKESQGNVVMFSEYEKPLIFSSRVLDIKIPLYSLESFEQKIGGTTVQRLSQVYSGSRKSTFTVRGDQDLRAIDILNAAGHYNTVEPDIKNLEDSRRKTYEKSFIVNDKPVENIRTVAFSEFPILCHKNKNGKKKELDIVVKRCNPASPNKSINDSFLFSNVIILGTSDDIQLNRDSANTQDFSFEFTFKNVRRVVKRFVLERYMNGDVL